MVETIEELSKEIAGHQIESMEDCHDGLHVNISNGQTVIIVGAAFIGLLDKTVTIQ